MTRETVLITGVAGFIGRYTARYFSKKGWSTIGIDYSARENAPLSNLTAYHQLKLPDTVLAEILKDSNPQVCVHCAGSASVGLSMTDPSTDFYSNTVLTFEVLNALRLHAPTCKFIFLSSAAVYGNPPSLPVSETHPVSPISPYGFHKWQCEKLCQEFSKVYSLKTAILRIFSAYGPGLRRQVIWDICYKVITRDASKLQGTGNESRDFIHAQDIVRALVSIINSGNMQGEVYNLGSGKEVTIAQLTNLVLGSLEYDKILEFDGVVPEGTPLNWCAEISKLKQLGFSISVPLEDGVKTFADWCRAELSGI